MATLKLTRDTNGNKTLRYSPGRNSIGFSVQTNQNLPKTHRMSGHNFEEEVVLAELTQHVELYGTMRQKRLING